jgi:hypothetical protein
MAARLKRGGSAQTLRNYWSGKGKFRNSKGSKKIRWGQPGDFKRCVRATRKYLARPEGYCALRHKQAIGVWPGQESGKRRRSR